MRIQFIFARRSPHSVRRPLLPDLSLVLSTSTPLSSRLKPISDTRIAHYRRPTLQASTTLHRQQLHIARAAHSRSPVGSQYSPPFRKGFIESFKALPYVLFPLLPLALCSRFQDILFHIRLTVERRHLRLTLALAVARIATIRVLVFNLSRLALTRDMHP
jgi:hypothetical protein